MKWEHLLEGISVIDSERGHDYWTSHCGRGRIQKDGDVEVGRQSGPRRQTVFCGAGGFLNVVLILGKTLKLNNKSLPFIYLRYYTFI